MNILTKQAALQLGLGGFLLLAGCATSPGDQRVELAATLTGIQQVPEPGDPDGTGTATVRVNAPDGQLCWVLYVRQIEPATVGRSPKRK